MCQLYYRTMSEHERKEFIQLLRTYKQRLAKDKSASRKFLMKTGILTQKGNLSSHYKNLCIPHEPA